MDSLEVLGRDRPVLEITPAMIEVGVDFFVEWDSDFYSGPYLSASMFVREVFRRMASKSANPLDAAAS